MNGNEHDDIKQRFMDVADACHALTEALRGIKEVTNGRNYQTLPNGPELADSDRDQLLGMMVSVSQIYEMSVSGASRAIKQREGI